MRIIVDGRDRTSEAITIIGSAPEERQQLGDVVRRLDPRKIEEAAMQKWEVAGDSSRPVSQFIIEVVAEFLDDHKS